METSADEQAQGLLLVLALPRSASATTLVMVAAKNGIAICSDSRSSTPGRTALSAKKVYRVNDALIFGYAGVASAIDEHSGKPFFDFGQDLISVLRADGAGIGNQRVLHGAGRDTGMKTSDVPAKTKEDLTRRSPPESRASLLRGLSPEVLVGLLIEFKGSYKSRSRCDVRHRLFEARHERLALPAER